MVKKAWCRAGTNLVFVRVGDVAKTGSVDERCSFVLLMRTFANLVREFPPQQLCIVGHIYYGLEFVKQHLNWVVAERDMEYVRWNAVATVGRT